MRPAARLVRSVRGARERPPALWLAAGATVAALAWAAGPPGAVAGLAVATVGLASAPVAAALAHVWLVALLPAGPAVAELAAVEAGVLALLAAPDGGEPVRTGVATVAAVAGLSGVAWLVLGRTGSTALAGVALVAVGSVTAVLLDSTAGGIGSKSEGRSSADGGQP